jgi:hypothetical protein
MPLKTWNDKATFDAAYLLRLDDGSIARYQRDGLFSQTDPRHDYVTPEWSRILAHFAWPTSVNLLVLGCGFGWSVEYLRAQGYTNAWGSDPSTYIQAEKANTDSRGKVNSTDPTRVRSEDPVNERANLLKNTIGQNARWNVIVTERLLSSLTDTEIITYAALLRATNFLETGGRIVHIETPTPRRNVDSTMNWKTLAEWKTLLPLDSIVRSGGAEILE